MFGKRRNLISLMALAALTVGCTGPRNICLDKNGKQECRLYSEVGLFNLDQKDPAVEYGLAWEEIVWGVVLSPTVIYPIIVVGWHVLAPIGPKKGTQAGTAHS